MGSCGTFSEEAVKGRCDMNKVLKTMVAVAALTLSANAEYLTANEAAFLNKIQRVFLTWNGKDATQYEEDDPVLFSTTFGECEGLWRVKANVTEYLLDFDLGDEATCNDYLAIYRKTVRTINTYGITTVANEDNALALPAYKWTLTDGTTIKITAGYVMPLKPKTETCTKRHDLAKLGCPSSMLVTIHVPR